MGVPVPYVVSTTTTVGWPHYCCTMAKAPGSLLVSSDITPLGSEETLSYCQVRGRSPGSLLREALLTAVGMKVLTPYFVAFSDITMAGYQGACYSLTSVNI